MLPYYHDLLICGKAFAAVLLQNRRTDMRTEAKANIVVRVFLAGDTQVLRGLYTLQFLFQLPFHTTALCSGEGQSIKTEADLRTASITIVPT